MAKEKELLEAVIVFLVRDKSILLARKAHHIGKGCWNGYGGGLRRGESAIDAAIRELREECGVRVHARALNKRALIDFHNCTSQGKHFTCTCHVYCVRRWEGEVQASDEMHEPTWFPISKLPFSEMMPADRTWLPPVLAGSLVVGEAWYGPHQKVLLRPTKIRLVKSLGI